MKNYLLEAWEWLKTQKAWSILMIIGWSMLIVKFSLDNDSHIGMCASIIALISFLLALAHSTYHLFKL